MQRLTAHFIGGPNDGGKLEVQVAGAVPPGFIDMPVAITDLHPATIATDRDFRMCRYHLVPGSVSVFRTRERFDSMADYGYEP